MNPTDQGPQGVLPDGAAFLLCGSEVGREASPDHADSAAASAGWTELPRAALTPRLKHHALCRRPIANNGSQREFELNRVVVPEIGGHEDMPDPVLYTLQVLGPFDSHRTGVASPDPERASDPAEQ
jgi:hypothetical protein